MRENITDIKRQQFDVSYCKHSVVNILKESCDFPLEVNDTKQHKQCGVGSVRRWEAAEAVGTAALPVPAAANVYRPALACLTGNPQHS